MIITQLLGGLGNQLFQYAVGRALAAKHGTSLVLDTSTFASYALRTYALDHFNIEASLLSDEERARLGLSPAPTTRIGRVLRRVFGRVKIPVIKERSFQFDPELFDSPASCYLEGWWQSSRYFSAIEPQIRKEFTVRDALKGANLAMAEQVAACTAVALHVRRADYVNDPVSNRAHGTCSPEYYEAAENILRQKIGSFRLFIFSDDPDWADSNLRFQSPATVLRINGPERDYEDLRLMTLCRHHIIANSTFSWWGAWLCAHDRKIVIAPKHWFREASHSTADLIPDGWLRV